MNDKTETKNLPEGAEVLDGGQIRYPLKYPVTVTLKDRDGTQREEKIDSLVIRRPKIKEITDAGEATARNKAAAIYEFTAKLTGYTKQVIEELDAEDFMEVQDIIEGFTPKSLQTPPISSAT